MVTAQEALGGMWDNWTRRGRRGAAGGQGGAASAAETQKYDKVQTWGPHHTDKGGQRVPQLRSCWNVPKTAILARGPRAPVQRTPLFPPHCTARSASRWRGSSTAPDHGQLAPRCKPRHQPQPWRRLVRTGS